MTSLERLEAFEREYLKECGWVEVETPVPGITYWAKDGPTGTHGMGVPQLTAAIWERTKQTAMSVFPQPMETTNNRVSQ